MFEISKKNNKKQKQKNRPELGQLSNDKKNPSYT